MKARSERSATSPESVHASTYTSRGRPRAQPWQNAVAALAGTRQMAVTSMPSVTRDSRASAPMSTMSATRPRSPW